MPATRLLIIANDPLARAGLAALLGGQEHVTVVGQTNDADLDAVLSVFEPDVLMWDLGWDPASAVETVAALNETHATPIVALIASPVVAGELRAAGARALLSRDSDGARLAAAAVAVTHGLLVIDEAVGADAAPLPAPMAGDDMVESLSARELDVLRQIAEGLSNKEIARALDISEHTVKFHVNAILGKLGAQSRTEAVVRATRAGLILL